MKRHSLKTSVWIGLVFVLMQVSVSSPVARAQQDQGNGQRPSTKEMPAPLKVAPGDLLHITVFDVPEMTQDVRIGAKGEAQLALIGNIDLAGLTGEEAAAAIARELRNRKLLLSPQVNVLIKEFSNQGVSVIGEVQHPGVFQVLGSRSLLDLLSMAGGLTNVADTRITVKRRRGSAQAITVKLKTDDPDTSLTNDVQIYPGDLIVVPRAGIVYVLGEVNRPGGFVMQDSGKITILQALAQAGGASRTASLNNSVLLRKNERGYLSNKLPLNKIARGQGEDLELHANDIIFVPNNKLRSIMHDTQGAVAAIGSASIYAVVH
jgi:polysaccharide export outer membrane protein